MRADLLDANASVEWAFAQLLPFHQRLTAWLEANVVIEVRDVPLPATHNPIVALEKDLLPIAFSVEAGAYINVIRSSLDILAMTLVRRHGLAISENRVYFPRARRNFPIGSAHLSYSGCPPKKERSSYRSGHIEGETPRFGGYTASISFANTADCSMFKSALFISRLRDR